MQRVARQPLAQRRPLALPLAMSATPTPARHSLLTRHWRSRRARRPVLVHVVRIAIDGDPVARADDARPDGNRAGPASLDVLVGELGGGEERERRREGSAGVSATPRDQRAQGASQVRGDEIEGGVQAYLRTEVALPLYLAGEPEEDPGAEEDCGREEGWADGRRRGRCGGGGESIMGQVSASADSRIHHLVATLVRLVATDGYR